jgi:hypothetical protein
MFKITLFCTYTAPLEGTDFKNIGINKDRTWLLEKGLLHNKHDKKTLKNTNIEDNCKKKGLIHNYNKYLHDTNIVYSFAGRTHTFRVALLKMPLTVFTETTRTTPSLPG